MPASPKMLSADNKTEIIKRQKNKYIVALQKRSTVSKYGKAVY